MTCENKTCHNNTCSSCTPKEKMGEKESLHGFYVVGITAQILKGNKSAADEINALWQRFVEETSPLSRSWTTGESVYVVYHDYEGDHTAPFKVTIGYKREHPASLPEEHSLVHVQSGTYGLFAARGPQPEALAQVWQTIWKADIKRCYKTDLEIYGPRFFEEGLHEVLVCIGIDAEEVSFK